MTTRQEDALATEEALGADVDDSKVNVHRKLHNRRNILHNEDSCMCEGTNLFRKINIINDIRINLDADLHDYILRYRK